MTEPGPWSITITNSEKSAPGQGINVLDITRWFQMMKLNYHQVISCTNIPVPEVKFICIYFLSPSSNNSRTHKPRLITVHSKVDGIIFLTIIRQKLNAW